MSIFKNTARQPVDDYQAELFDADIADVGFVGAHTRILSANSEAYAAWESLAGSIAASLGLRRYELATLAAARALHSTHCLLAHGRKSLAIFERDQLLAIARDYHHADLTPAEVVLMDFASKVSTDAESMTDADSQTLRDAGYSDREIVDIALAAAARNFYSRAVQALAVDVDPPGILSPRVAAALVNGL